MKAKKRLENLFEDPKTEYPTIFRSNEVVELNPEMQAYIVAGAGIMLDCAAGLSGAQIAEDHQTSQRTVTKWRPRSPASV